MPKLKPTRYLKVTESDSWKRHIALLSPVFVHRQVTGHIEPECVVLGRKDKVQQEQLADRVADVEDLGDEKQHDEVVAQSTSQRCIAI